MAYRLASQYKKYRTARFDAGGLMDMENNKTATAMGVPGGSMDGNMGSSLSGAGMAASGIIDAAGGTDQYGRKPTGAAIGSDALKGASVGASFGPWGAAAGAVVGAAYGYFSSASAKKKEERFVDQKNMAYNLQNMNRSNAMISADPSLVTGHQFASMYAMGGQMETAGGTVVRPEDRRKPGSAYSRPLADNYLSRMTRADGGSLTPMSNDSVSINGPSHEGGGVQLPDAGAEVEGGETMKGNFVFSDRLGFADEHKRISKAIGRVQAKGVMTPEKVNAIRRMQDQENTLALSQEYMKHILSGGQLPDPTQQSPQSPQQ